MSTTILQAGPSTPIATPSDVDQVAADLRYRIAEALIAGWRVPGLWLPIVTIGSETISASSDVMITENTDGTLSLISGISGDELAICGSDGVLTENLRIDTLGVGEDVPVVGVTALEPVAYALADRTVNLITAQSGEAASIDIELPAAVTVDGVRHCRDFILDVDNSANASDLALEFTGLGVDYAFVPLEDDSVSEMMTIGAGERVRLYFTETPYITSTVPVINVASVTLGDFVTTSTTPATQGGN